MSNSNNALLAALPHFRPMVVDSIVANIGGTQATGAAIKSAATRILNGGTGSSVVLPSLTTGESEGNLVFIVNDTTTTVLVFCALGETMNGSSNGSLTIAGGGFGIFVPREQVYFAAAAPDWRAAAFT